MGELGFHKNNCYHIIWYCISITMSPRRGPLTVHNFEEDMSHSVKIFREGGGKKKHLHFI